MELYVKIEGRRGLSDQIYQQLRATILEGRLRPGERLPPTRELAQRLQVSRNTVTVAYEKLAAEGFLNGAVGAGSFVGSEALAMLNQRGAPDQARIRPRAIWQTLPPPIDLLVRMADYDFRAGVVDAQLFPFDIWHRLMARELHPSAEGVGEGGAPSGHAGLRAAIARHVGVSRGVRANAEDVVVTSGTQQALDLIGRVLIEPGDCVAVEDPGYSPARLVFQSLGARVIAVPVGADGLEVDAIPEDARLVYVTPSHQFPLGMPMSLSRRIALLAWAERRDAVVIEDDYDSEFRFAGRPLEPLQALDRSGRVLYTGTFSKVLLPNLRLGFVVGPPSLRPALRRAKFVCDWFSQVPGQAALCRFIDEGQLARHIRKLRREYQLRHERVLRAIARDLAGWLEPIPSAAGLHLSAVLRVGNAKDAEDVVNRARAADVAIQSLSRFYAGEPGLSGFVFGYGGIPVSKIDEGMKRVARCLAQVIPRQRSSR